MQAVGPLAQPKISGDDKLKEVPYNPANLA
jgi:hypothetical protein